MSTDSKSTSYIPELWGGIECSLTRVGDRLIDQLKQTGHDRRAIENIRRFSIFKFAKMRYPVLWEKHQRHEDDKIDFEAAARQLDSLLSTGIEPIVGLLHHGDGPMFTDLLDPDFPAKFARYAGAVAQRFPWIKYYTPINEPLTTARFSGLYGWWYPHRRDDRDFATIFLNQMKAIVLAMEAIREVNPTALLVQTEDLCKTYSTPLLQYQADFENQRRWLTMDTLCGKFNARHPLWPFISNMNVPFELLDFFNTRSCPPDIIGADYYLTSERFLDENVEQYPSSKHGGNHVHRYADVEAIRVKHGQPYGLPLLISECWARYRIPIAVTEVHLNSTSEDQVRWFKQVWDEGVELNQSGIPVVAVTSWSLLGAYGWNSLLTEEGGEYEPGAFSVVSGEPVLTEFGEYLRGFSQDHKQPHPALMQAAWWHQTSRCFYNVEPPCGEVLR